MASLESIPTCWICSKPVLLENCKIDEHGRPVHENCYVTRLALEMAQPPIAANRAARKSH
jgi:hypothetical protein